MLKFVRQGSEGGAGRVQAPAWAEGTLEKQCPALKEYMSAPLDDNGNKREGLTLLFCVDAGALKAWIHDRDGRRSAWVTASSLEGLFCLIEEGLRDDDLMWRPTEQRKKGK